MGGCEREVCLVAEIYSSLKFTPSLRYKYDALFDSLNPIDGKVTGASAKGWWRFPHKYFYSDNFHSLGEMIKSKLPNNVLGKIWKLSDVDR